MLKPFFLGLALASSAFATAPAFAAKPPVFTEFLSDVAVGGYDAVSFFSATPQNGPMRGSDKFEFAYKGAKWRFSSAENLAKFQAEPAKYAPQFGGYCAWAVSQGYTAKGDPKYWRVVDGKLYLNYDGNVQKRWEADIPGFISKAHANWPRVIQ